MESKLNRQKNAMISLAKPKNKNSLPDKKDTWGNLLNKKSTSTKTVIGLNKKSHKSSSNSDRVTKTTSKSVQCDSPKISPSIEFCQNSNLLSVFNPIRTLQFLLKEIMEIPNVKNTNTIKVVNEMQAVVERIVDECSKKSELHVPIMDENIMIPTRENDYNHLKYNKNVQENKYWLVLLEKISELENSYSQLTKNYTKSGEKLQNITSERDKLLEKFKESCDLLETLNNREREYLNTITELKAKVMASEKLISKQEAIIINLNQKLKSSVNKSQELVIEKVSPECQKIQQAVSNKNHQFKHNDNLNKLNLHNLKINNSFRNGQVSKHRSDIQEMNKIVQTGLENSNIDSVSMTSLKPEGNHKTHLSEYSGVNKNDVEYNIDVQYSEYNRQALAIKLAKAELQQLFETIKLQAYDSKKLFNSTLVDNEKNLSGISDEDDNHSNFMSVVTDSSC